MARACCRRRFVPSWISRHRAYRQGLRPARCSDGRPDVAGGDTPPRTRRRLSTISSRAPSPPLSRDSQLGQRNDHALAVDVIGGDMNASAVGAGRSSSSAEIKDFPIVPLTRESVAVAKRGNQGVGQPTGICLAGRLNRGAAAARRSRSMNWAMSPQGLPPHVIGQRPPA